MEGALAETKEAISPPSGTTAFPRRSINVTRVKDETRRETNGGASRRVKDETVADRYINNAQRRGGGGGGGDERRLAN